MGGKSGGGSSQEAQLARQDEQQRQQSIREGTARIDEIFGGKTVGSGALDAGATYDPNATYYNADGSAWVPQTQSAAPLALTGQQYINGRVTPVYSQPAAVDGASQFADAVGGGKLFSGTTTEGGFNDAFFDGRRQAYLDYATPQLDQQYSDAQRELSFALARAGTLDSSVRADKTAELQQLYDLNRQKIADDALASETAARTAVENARSDLVATLNATGDAEGAANSALARSAALSEPAAFSPLASLFVDFTNSLGAQAAASRANNLAYGGTSGTGASLFNNSSNAVKVT